MSEYPSIYPSPKEAGPLPPPIGDHQMAPTKTVAVLPSYGSTGPSDTKFGGPAHAAPSGFSYPPIHTTVVVRESSQRSYFCAPLRPKTYGAAFYLLFVETILICLATVWVGTFVFFGLGLSVFCGLGLPFLWVGLWSARVSTQLQAFFLRGLGFDVPSITALPSTDGARYGGFFRMLTSSTSWRSFLYHVFVRPCTSGLIIVLFFCVLVLSIAGLTAPIVVIVFVALAEVPKWAIAAALVVFLVSVPVAYLCLVCMPGLCGIASWILAGVAGDGDKYSRGDKLLVVSGAAYDKGGAVVSGAARVTANSSAEHNVQQFHSGAVESFSGTLRNAYADTATPIPILTRRESSRCSSGLCTATGVVCCLCFVLLIGAFAIVSCLWILYALNCAEFQTPTPTPFLEVVPDMSPLSSHAPRMSVPEVYADCLQPYSWKKGWKKGKCSVLCSLFYDSSRDNWRHYVPDIAPSPYYDADFASPLYAPDFAPSPHYAPDIAPSPYYAPGTA